MDRGLEDRGAGEGGLYLRGRIVGRTTRLIEAGVRYAYTIATGTVQYRVTVWGEHEHYRLNDDVELEVHVHCYLSNKGKPMFQLVLPSGLQSNEEAF